MATDDKRRAHRYDVDLAAEVRIGKRVIPARTKNLSETGVCLESPMAFQEGGILDVNLILTVDGIEDVSTPPLELGASVVWSTPGNDRAHISGLEFSGIDAEKAGVLKGYLALLRD